MTAFRVSGVRIAGVANAVPKRFRTVRDEAGQFPGENIDKIGVATGVATRHVSETLRAVDLGEVAIRQVLSALDWEPASVDMLMVVTQTPDYWLPANSCLLQARAGLSDECMALDMNLGCSGFVYGLAQASAMLSSTGKKRALLVAGDTSSHFVSPQDKATLFLFGDAVSAVALELDPDAPPIHFALGTDGRGAPLLMIPAGGFRCPATAENAVRTPRESGNIRSDQDIAMNGAEVFAFSLRRVPAVVQKILSTANWQAGEVDHFIFHQANSMMLKVLGKRLGIPEAKLPFSLDKYGNTASASIPLTISHALSGALSGEARKLLLVGFGVGFSWGAAAVQIDHLVAPEVTFVEEKA
jgi:3-oxoacyl-[acyl-carrier-protein] synthase-3